MNSLARITTKTSASVVDVNPDAVIDFILLQQQQQQRPIAEAPAAAATIRHGILVCFIQTVYSQVQDIWSNFGAT